MHGLHVLMVGLSAAHTRLCEKTLKPVYPGLRITQISAAGEGIQTYPVADMDLVLVNCKLLDMQSLAFLRSVKINSGPPVLALVETFEPVWVNRLTAAGATQVLPFDHLDRMLVDIAALLCSSDPGSGFQAVEEIETNAGLSASDQLSAQLQKIISAPNFFESVLGNLPVLLVALDLEGRIILFNRRCEAVSGYMAAEVQGRLLSDILLLPEERRGVQEAFEKLQKGNGPVTHQNAWLTKDGRTRQILWSNAAALINHQGSAIFIVGMGEDITEAVLRQDQLRDFENRFERIFHASPIGIGLVRYKDMTVIDSNQSLLALLDRERNEVVGLPADQIGLFPRQGAREMLDIVARQGPLLNREWRVMVRGKRTLHILISLEMIEWSREPAILVMVRDVTDRVQSEEKMRALNNELERRVLERTRALDAINREKQAEVEYRKAIESSSQRLNQIIWELPDVMAISEVGGRFQYINKAGRKLLNISDFDPVSHLSVYDCYPADIRAYVQKEVVPAVRVNGMWSGQLELQLQGGNCIPISQTILAHQNQDGENLFFSTIIRDITEETQAAEKIKKAYQAEKEMGLFRATIFSMTSHQFRTPLSTILSSAELLEHYSAQWENDKRILHLQRIQQQAQLLNEMLNDILEIGRLELHSAEVELEIMDLCAVVDRCVENCVFSDGGRHQIHLDCVEGTLPILSAPRLIDRAVDNLLSNAVKYSPSTSRVSVRVYSKDGIAVIEVSDAGRGISAEDLPLLFQPFHRGGNAGDVAGSGLGLMIVKRSLELIGGTVQVESELHSGTRVEVRIPLKNEVDHADFGD